MRWRGGQTSAAGGQRASCSAARRMQVRPLRGNEMGGTVRLRRTTTDGASVGVGGEPAARLAWASTTAPLGSGVVHGNGVVRGLQRRGRSKAAGRRPICGSDDEHEAATEGEGNKQRQSVTAFRGPTWRGHALRYQNRAFQPTGTRQRDAIHLVGAEGHILYL